MPGLSPAHRKKLAAPARLVLAETVLQRLRPLARGTPLWEDSAISTNEMLEHGTSFSRLVLTGEVPKSQDSSLFLHKHWLAAAGAKSDGNAFFVARQASPQSLTLRTCARLAYLAALGPFARALDGLSLALEEERSWTWDHQVMTSKQRPLYRTAYLLHIDLSATAPFDAGKWLRTAAQDVCTSTDARADRCLFQLAEEADVDYR